MAVQGSFCQVVSIIVCVSVAICTFSSASRSLTKAADIRAIVKWIPSEYGC